jgi:hypothetical protein
VANVLPTIKPIPGQNNIDGYQVIWTPLTSTNTAGEPVGSPIGINAGDGAQGLGFLAGFADKSVAVTGTFGSATLVIQGSNDGTNWFTLTDPNGNLLSFTSAPSHLLEVTESVIMLQPSTSGGGTQSLTVAMFFRKTNQP